MFIRSNKILLLPVESASKLGTFRSTIQPFTNIQEIFKTKNIDRIISVDLIKSLCTDREKPRTTYNKGSPISPRQIVNSLKEFKINSNTIRIGATTAKGYLKSQFEYAFVRYLSTSAAIKVTTS